MTALDICTDAAKEIGIVSPGDSLSAGDADDILSKLNRLLDNWNAERMAVYADSFTQYTLTPNLAPHTIGPTGATWTATIRPVTIESASLVLDTSSPDVFTGIRLRDAAWWAAQTVPDLTSSIPTDLYYQPDWPLGKLYFWPVPTVAYPVELHTRMLLASLAIGSTFTMPPGYQDAVTLSLSEAICPMYGQQVTPDLQNAARIARARVFSNNLETPRLATLDAGMPGGSGGSTFNYLSRNW